MVVPKTERQEALERLRAAMPPGTTLYTILRHVSRSGMMRHISVKTGLEGQWDWAVATVLGEHLAPGEGIKVSGAGMDMGFHLVYSLSRTLYPDGFGCLGVGCPSNEHSNGDRNFTPAQGALIRCSLCLDVHGKDGLGRPCKGCAGTGMVEGTHDPKHVHQDGGYALNHRWI